MTKHTHYRAAGLSRQGKRSRKLRLFAGLFILVVAVVLTVHHFTTTWQHAVLAQHDLTEAQVIPDVKKLDQPLAFGLSLGNTLYGMPADQMDAQLADMRALGVGWIRVDVGWDDVQAKDALTYDWAKTDAIVSAAEAHGLKVMGTLAYSPAWARPLGCKSPSCEPVLNAAFATFAGKAAARYAGKIDQWEIWNEPNLKKFWQPKPSVAKYVDMLKLTYPAIKAANQNAVGISAGLSPAENASGNIAPRDFLSDMYKAGAKPVFDVLGFHPYSYPAPATTNYGWSAWSQMADQGTSVRSIMQANGDEAKKVWITEYGAPTAGPGDSASITTYSVNQDAGHVDEELQAYTLQAAVSAIGSQNWVGGFFWYSYKDLGTDTSDSENFFGLLRADGTKKPAYDVLRKMLNPDQTTPSN